MNLAEYIKDKLEKDGYDGLFCTESGEYCCCFLDDFMPCEEPWTECIPGYKGVAEDSEGPFEYIERYKQS